MCDFAAAIVNPGCAFGQRWFDVEEAGRIADV
jgi:hypothetical protein